MPPTKISGADEISKKNEASKQSYSRACLIETVTTDSMILCGPRLMWSPNMQAEFHPIFSADEKNLGF